MAYALAESDGNYSDKERMLIESYCQEMKIAFNPSCIEMSEEFIIKNIRENSTEKIRKIIVFEAIGLVMADGKYDNQERALIIHMQEEFGLESEFVAECEAILREYILLQERINKLILL